MWHECKSPWAVPWGSAPLWPRRFCASGIGFILLRSAASFIDSNHGLTPDAQSRPKLIQNASQSRVVCLCLDRGHLPVPEEPVRFRLHPHPEGVYVCCYRYNYLGFTCLDQLALCLISWLAAVCVSDLQSAFSISGQQFSCKQWSCGCTALHCFALHYNALLGTAHWR